MTNGKPPIRILLAEAPLELVPRELWSHPSVYKYARKRGKPPASILLDSNVHHQAMKRLTGKEWRGRPDIVHTVLLVLLDSPLVKKGLAEVIVHTAADYMITIDPSTRLPRNYLRFTGLIEQLFENGQVPPNTDKPLLTVKPASLEAIIKIHKMKPVLIDQYDGEPVPIRELVGMIEEERVNTIIVPSTPHALITPKLRHLDIITYKIRNLGEAEPWTIVSHILVAVALSQDLL